MALSKAIPTAFALVIGLAARSSATETLPPVLQAETRPIEAARAPAIVEVAPKLKAAWVEDVPALEIKNANTGAEAVIRLYAADGELDPAAVSAFARVATDGLGPLAPRVMQLAVKAAAHFHSHQLIIVSAYRPLKRGKGGYHARGEALDFKLPGVDSRKLASHLRSYPRAGVGIYTNPNTQFVHLDARDQSFHWLDASPPGRTWREAPLADPERVARDAAYTPHSDLPIP
ncbi:MAG: DUF882 domain-containing protein [Polyangiaceae bacterium]